MAPSAAAERREPVSSSSIAADEGASAGIAADPHGGYRMLLHRHGSALTAGVVALALLLRLPALWGWWVNPDEGIYYAILARESFGAFWLEAKATAHPPLYFLMLRAMGSLSTELAWLRSVALLSGCAAVYVFVLVGRALAADDARAPLTGLLAGLVLALSPDAIVLSQVIRPYMTLVALLGAALYFVLRYEKRPSAGFLSAYAATASLALLLHYSAVLGLAVVAGLVLWRRASGRIDDEPWRRLLRVQIVPAGILAALYFWHLRGVMGSTEVESARQGWLAAYMIDGWSEAWFALVGFHAMLVGDTLAVGATFLSLLGLGWAVYARASAPLLLCVLPLLMAIGGAVAELYPFAGTRHASWLLPFVVPALAWGTAFSLGSSRRAWTLVLPVAGALAVAAGQGEESLARQRAAHDVNEHVLRVEHVEAMGELLDPAAPPRLVVMSLETYRLLVPLYATERQRARMSPDRLYAHFRWGARDVIVLPGADFAAGPEGMGQPNHLYTATRAAAAGFGIPFPAQGEPVLVLSGGWHIGGVFDLANLADGLGISGEATSVPGLIALSLDLQAYGRALANAR